MFFWYAVVNFDFFGRYSFRFDGTCVAGGWRAGTGAGPALGPARAPLYKNA